MVSKNTVAVALALMATLASAVPTDWHRKAHHVHHYSAGPWIETVYSYTTIWVDPTSSKSSAAAPTSVKRTKVSQKTAKASTTSVLKSSSHVVTVTSSAVAVSSTISMATSYEATASSAKFPSAILSSAKVSSVEASSATISSAEVPSSEASTAVSSATPEASVAASSKLTPHSLKAGTAGGDAYTFWENHMGWWWDYTPFPNKTDSSKSTAPVSVPILWGDGHVDATDKERFDYFTSVTSKRTDLPYVMGFYEPDCSSTGSSDMPDVDAAAVLWEELVAPMKKAGTLLGSPGMCKQADETWLQEFKSKITTMWDFTTIHINKIDMDGVNTDLDHYWDNYGLPIWVTEFSCVQDNPWVPSTDQNLINEYITNIVPLLESDDRVMAYAYSTGEGLAEEWKPVINGQLTESGQKYLDVISSL